MVNIYKLAGGIISIIIGCYVLYSVITKPFEKESDYTKENLNAYIVGFGGVVLGIALLYDEITQLID